jgi:hypoxanthine phosphoribosyltransferase
MSELPEAASRARSCHVASLFSADQVAERVRQLAAQISGDYADQHPLLVGVLKGAWLFMADLVRQLTIPVCCDFVRVSSYGVGTTTSGEPRLLLDVTEPMAGRHVLLVDDIIDTGISVSWLLRHLRQSEPVSLKLCSLLDKPSRRRVPIQADYVGFEIPDRFVVGYGIDYAEQYRELPYIGYVTDHDA